MKIIDKTPFQNPQGQINFSGRVQGTLKYGGNWYPETLAQKVVIDQLGLVLEKGFVLLRNYNLPGSEIIVPLILVGVHGVTVIYVTHLKGQYEAKGDEWNRRDQARSLPARINLLDRTVRLARATQKFLDHYGISVPAPVSSVLMAAYPGLQVETLRPVTRVVMSDAIKQYANSLLQARPLLRPEQVYDLADRIQNPIDLRPPVDLPAAAPIPTSPPQASAPEGAPAASRARAIFDAAQSTPPFDPDDLSFAFGDEAAVDDLRAGLVETNPAQPRPAPAPRKKRTLGMQPRQLGCLGLLAVVECCVLAAAGYFIFLRP